MKATPSPPVSSFPIHYFFPFPLSIYLPFPHPHPPSTSLTNTRKNIYQAYGKLRKAVHRTGVGRNDEHKRLTVKDNKIISFSFTAKGMILLYFTEIITSLPLLTPPLSLLASFFALLFFITTLLPFSSYASSSSSHRSVQFITFSLPPSHFPFLPLHEILFSNSSRSSHE